MGAYDRLHLAVRLAKVGFEAADVGPCGSERFDIELPLHAENLCRVIRKAGVLPGEPNAFLEQRQRPQHVPHDSFLDDAFCSQSSSPHPPSTR